jgi:orotidine-5'-phosphate decarboxylase
MIPFGTRLAETTLRAGTALVAGLDPVAERLPDGVDVESFCMGVLDAVAGLVGTVKPQSAFFEAHGSTGVAVLERVVGRARDLGLLVLLDAKRGDIGSTMEAYRRATVDPDGPMGADAVTLSPWLGPESLAPFLVGDGRGAFVLLRTSNPGASRWQAPVADDVASWIAERNAASASWGDVGAVVGATLGDEVLRWRARLPKTWLLLPGVGAQGGSVADARAGMAADGLGALVPVSRDLLYPKKGCDGPDFVDRIRDRAASLASALRL